MADGIHGLSVGDEVTAEQMTRLFGTGEHPLGDDSGPGCVPPNPRIVPSACYPISPLVGAGNGWPRPTTTHQRITVVHHLVDLTSVDLPPVVFEHWAITAAHQAG